MATKTLKFISMKMKKIDLCMLSTISTRGVIRSRPMSNNGDVKYDGNSFFFTYEDSQKIKDIQRDTSVSLTFTTRDKMFITVMGKARIIRSKAIMEEHWIPSLGQWFKKGLDTPGILMIGVKAQKIMYWNKSDQGEINVK